MNDAPTIVATVEGPNGVSQVVEVTSADGKALEYKTVFKGEEQNFKSMGEAYITAKERAGVKV